MLPGDFLLGNTYAIRYDCSNSGYIDLFCMARCLRQIEKAGGKALPLVVDVRDEDSVANAMEKTMVCTPLASTLTPWELHL